MMSRKELKQLLYRPITNILFYEILTCICRVYMSMMIYNITGKIAKGPFSIFLFCDKQKNVKLNFQTLCILSHSLHHIHICSLERKRYRVMIKYTYVRMMGIMLYEYMKEGALQEFNKVTLGVSAHKDGSANIAISCVLQ